MSTVVVAMIFLFAQPAAAHAYIDPGTGLFVLQGVISVVLGGVFLARQRIKMFWDTVFRRKRTRNSVDRDSMPNEPPDQGSES